MADVSNTRRGLLGAMLLAPIAVSMPAVAAPSDFNAKMAAHDELERRELAHDRHVLERCQDDYEALVDAIQHETVEWQPICPHGTRPRGEVWSTDDEQKIKNARYFLDPRHVRPMAAHLREYHQSCLALLAAVERRKQAIARVRIDSGIEAAEAEADRLMSLRCDARDAVIACPVASAAEIATKIRFVTEHDRWDDPDTQAAITADVARLVSV